MKKKALFFSIFLLVFSNIVAQVDQDSTQKAGAYEKIFDFGDQVVDLISTEKWAIIPALIYSPETSLGFGARAIRVFRPNGEKSENLRPSTFLFFILESEMIRFPSVKENDMEANTFIFI